MIETRGAGCFARVVSFPLPLARLPQRARKVLSTMTSSKPVQRAARQRGELRRDGGDLRVRPVITARFRSEHPSTRDEIAAQGS
jgi:hypothetical protein